MATQTVRAEAEPSHTDAPQEPAAPAPASSPPPAPLAPVPDSRRSDPLQIWSAPQRRVLIGLLLILFIWLTVRAILNPMHVTDPQPRDPPRAHELADRIDPNTADWNTLAAMPNIGEKRAREIIAYREQFEARHPGKRAFTRIEDLYHVRGFGVAMVEHVRPYLYFPSDPPVPEPE